MGIFKCFYNWMDVSALPESSSGLPTRPSFEEVKAPGRRQLLPRPAAAPILMAAAPDMARIYEKVRTMAVPNYRGARISLSSKLKIQAWRDTVHIHGDKQLPDLLEFGFPSGHVSLVTPAVGMKNHASSIRNDWSLRERAIQSLEQDESASHAAEERLQRP